MSLLGQYLFEIGPGVYLAINITDFSLLLPLFPLRGYQGIVGRKDCVNNGQLRLCGACMPPRLSVEIPNIR